ncbi:adenylate/guanylate cyclase domain-containing protein [Pseudomonadota bacterium]
MSIRDADQAYADVLELLFTRSLEGWDIPAFICEVVECLGSLGMQLYRVSFGRPILHPLYAVGAYTWYRDSGVKVDTYARGSEERDAFQGSPIRPIFESGALEGRYRIRAGSDSDQFPIFVRAAAEGGTDYFVQLTGYDDRTVSPSGQEGFLLSWISAASAGFSDAEIDLLQRLRKPFCVELKSLTQQSLVEVVLRAYLGGYSADRVYAGQIQRGDGDIIDAVILFCDLRGSSALAEHYDLNGFLGVLNDYFAVTAGAVIMGGGEVLRYIGDASLAIFPIERYVNEQDACQAALDVALDSVVRAEHVNAARVSQGEPPIEFGIGLHSGTVMYGNIGTPDRIEFTVIGEAANEAARIEAKCKELNETILVSDTFARNLDRPWRSHGRFGLRNIGRLIEILSPSD